MLRILVMLVPLLAGAATPRPKTDPAAFEVARKWLKAVGTSEPTVLEKSTSMPFTYATTAKVKRCERRVTEAKALSDWLKCLRTGDKLFIDEIQHGDLMPSDPPNVESKALRSLGSKISREGKWVEAYVNGDGVTYTFRFLVIDQAVAAFLVNAEFETG